MITESDIEKELEKRGDKRIPDDIKEAYNVAIGDYFYSKNIVTIKQDITTRAQAILNKLKYSKLCEKVWEKIWNNFNSTRKASMSYAQPNRTISKHELNEALSGIVELPDESQFSEIAKKLKEIIENTGEIRLEIAGDNKFKHNYQDYYEAVTRILFNWMKEKYESKN